MKPLKILSAATLLLVLCLAFIIPMRSDDDEQLRRDVGEMLLVGFRGQHVSESRHIKRDIQQYHVGSVILFEYDAAQRRRHRNIASPAQLRQLCSELQALAEEPLLIGVDQEGGRVCRMRAVDGFPYVASAQKSASDGPDSVRFYAALTANMLRKAGVNFDFAPVADVNVNPACPIIGKLERSFSSDTGMVTQCCRTWLYELSRKGVAGCMKHFPGHGSSSGDTHAGLVDVSSSWQPYELAPYRALIAEGYVPAVMVAHVINDRIDSKWPASLSHKTITSLLRNQLGFEGVVVTDDLAMGAITNQYDYETVVYQAIAAGADMLCISNNGSAYDEDLVPRTVGVILRLVEEGRLSREQIHASAQRVRDLKAMIQ